MRIPARKVPMMNLPQDTVEFLRTRWWVVAAVSSAVGIAAVCVRASESDAVRKKRLQEAEKKELRAIANRISQYAKSVRERFPDGAVVVSEEALAAQATRLHRERPKGFIERAKGGTHASDRLLATERIVS